MVHRSYGLTRSFPAPLFQRHYASQSGGDSGDDAALLAGLPQRPSKPLTRAKLRRLRAAEGHAARVRGEYVEPQTGRYRQGWTDPKPEFRQCLRLAHALAKRWQDPYIFWSARAICRRTLLKAYEQPPESHAQDHRVFMRERSPQLVKARNAYKNLRERMRVYRKAWAGRRRDSQKLLEETYGRKGYLKHRLHNVSARPSVCARSSISLFADKLATPSLCPRTVAP